MSFVIFDLDGTLIDSRADIAAAANAALVQLGHAPLPTEVVQGLIGDGSRNLMLRSLGPERESQIEPALKAFFAYYGEHLVERTALYPGIREMLDGLRMPAAVLTNKPGDFARTICARLGVSSCFVEIWGEGDVEARKPDPRGALALCGRAGMSAECALFIGDSKTDAATARNAAIPFVGVSWGYGTIEQMRAHGAERFVGNSAELSSALESWPC